jgi:hypothetical protein
MTCNITQTPLYPEPLPLYSRHDPDAVSIHSAAPSYVSDTPTYTSRRPSNVDARPRAPPLLPPVSPTQRTRGLPSVDYAPGFQSRARGSVSDISSHNFNIASWSSTRTGTNSRQYEAVARRRASEMLVTSTAVSLTTMAGTYGGSPSNNGSPNGSSTNLNATPTNAGSSSVPVSPLEDPDLVGEEAARRARAQRIYREMCRMEEDASLYDSRSWEFMILQMGDWGARSSSPRNNKTRAVQKRSVGQRLGLRT